MEGAVKRRFFDFEIAGFDVSRTSTLEAILQGLRL
jgi:hypothetical protein